jgi:hypothetical protein
MCKNCSGEGKVAVTVSAQQMREAGEQWGKQRTAQSELEKAGIVVPRITTPAEHSEETLRRIQESKR